VGTAFTYLTINDGQHLQRRDGKKYGFSLSQGIHIRENVPLKDDGLAPDKVGPSGVP
jgi:hypothetical protein